MTTIRLGDELEQRLEHLAKATGRTKTFYIKKLIEDHIDDLEDLYIAQHRMETLAETSTLNEVRKKLELEH